MKLVLTVLMAINFMACANRVEKAVRKAKYSAYEMVGMEKRDLFKREVANIKEEQEETGETFKSALDNFKELYAFKGAILRSNTAHSMIPMKIPRRRPRM